MLNSELYNQYPLHVFTIYEEEAIDLEFLIGHSPLCDPEASPFLIRGSQRVCLIFHKNYSTPLGYDREDCWRKTYDPLFRRLLPSRECLEEYKTNVVYSDAEVTIRFLDKLCSVSFHQSGSK